MSIGSGGERSLSSTTGTSTSTFAEPGSQAFSDEASRTKGKWRGLGAQSYPGRVQRVVAEKCRSLVRVEGFVALGPSWTGGSAIAPSGLVRSGAVAHGGGKQHLTGSAESAESKESSYSMVTGTS